MTVSATETRDKLLGVDPGSPSGNPEETPAVPEAQKDQPSGSFDATKYVSREAHQEVLSRLSAAGEQIKELQSVAGLVKKAQQIFAPKGDQPELNERDQLIRSELLRIVPELAELKDVRDIKSTLHATGQAGVQQLATQAWNAQQEFQKDYDIAVGDAETSEMIGVNIKTWIEKDQVRTQRYFSGDKTVLEEGFRHVVSKLFGPQRLAQKRNTITRRDRLPTGGPTRGGSPASGGNEPSKLNFMDRKAVRAALGRAFPVEQE